MAREQGELALSHRLLQITAVAVLVAAGALAFARVFRGDMAMVKLLAAALGSVAVAGLLERRGPVLAVLGSAAGLILAVGWLVFPDTLYGGIFPTAHTFGEVGRALRQVSEQARVQVAPTVPLRPLLLAAVTAVWAASFASHALAARSGSPLLAALPPASLLAFADIILEDGARPQFAALFLVGALAVLFMDGLRRVRQWGPLHPWSKTGRRRFTSPTATRGARRLTAVALGAALLVPGVLPGYGHQGLLNLDTGPITASPVINPLVSVTASLHRQHPLDLFVVKAKRPSYWRWMALDQFDGTTWTTDDLDVGNGELVPAGGTLGRTSIEVPGEVRKQRLLQTITLLQPPGQWLPMAFHPDQVFVGGSSVRYDAAMAAAVPLVGAQPGLQYQVDSTIVEPTRTQLEAIPSKAFANPEYIPFTLLPSSTPPKITQLARQWSAAATTPFGKIMAIQQHLLTFSYDQDVSGAYDERTLVHFLTVTKRGFCQQFAAAMAVLVRSLGYPARVATGFTTGRFDPTDKVWRVSTANAHTWVEVLFPGYGWIPFEPTPGSTDPDATYLGSVSICVIRGGCGPGGPGQEGGTTGPNVTGSSREIFLEQNQTRPRASPQRGGPGRVAPHRRYAWVLPVLGILLAVALFVFLLLLPVAKTVSRRVRPARAGHPREVVLANFRSFTGRATDLGLARRPGETLREYRDRLRSRVSFSDGHLDRLTEITARAAYAAGTVSERDAGQAVADSKQAIRDIRRATPLTRRIGGLFRPDL